MALARYRSVAQDSAGNVIPNATVEVRKDEPGRPVVPLFSDRNGTVPIGNPFTADELGKFAFHAPGGVYYIRVFTGPSQAPFQQDTLRYVALGTAGERDVEDLAYALEAGTASFPTLPELQAFVPAADEGIGGKVTTGADGGYYHYDPEAEEGERWVFDKALDGTIAELVVTGGTPNAIEAAVDDAVPTASIKMLFLEPDDTNTDEVTINALPLLSVSGDALLPGQIIAGRSYLLTNEGDHYRLRQESDLTGIPDAVEAAGVEAVENINAAKEGIDESVAEAAGSASAADVSAIASAGSAVASSDDADRAETAAGAIQALVGIFADTTAGISGTSDGDYFAIPSPDDDESFLLYENDGGSAVPYKAYPSSAALTDAFGRGRGKTELVALAKTPAGKVPIWLDGGRFDTLGLGPRLSGAVLPAWSDGSGLAVFKGLLARKKYGDAVTAKLVVTGDSWAERQNIPQAMATKLYAMYGKGADGWLSPHGISADTLGPINGVVIARTGWTDHDITEEAESGAYGPDGLRLDATGTSATMSWTGLTAETVKLYYLDTAGTFRYRMDGGGWTSVVGGNTGAPAKVTMAGLNPAVTHTLEIDLTGNAGTVSIFGAYATGIAGVELSKMGNGEGLASDFLAIIGDAVPTYILADIAPHAAMVMLGTNDLSANVTPADFATGIAAITTAYLAASPTGGILLASPPRNGRTGFYSMEAYAWTSQAASSLHAQIEFFNFPAFWSDYAAMNTVGLWNDIGHLNSAGAYALSHQIIDRFFTIS